MQHGFHFAESWQGSYNVRFMQRVHVQTQEPAFSAALDAAAASVRAPLLGLMRRLHGSTLRKMVRAAI